MVIMPHSYNILLCLSQYNFGLLCTYYKLESYLKKTKVEEGNFQ
jgi:hypothetical protein